jgi:hypothetical protein
MRRFFLVAVALGLAACQGTARGRRTFRDDAAPRTDRGGVAGGPAQPVEPRVDPGCIPGTASIRVIWEALAVERQQVLAPRNGRPGAIGIAGMPDLEVGIVNSSFEGTPEQIEGNRAMRKQGALSRVSDREMLDLLKSIRDAGFYDYAKPTGAISALFASDRSRGRITIEEDGRSVTLLSQRGLGLAEETREIPGIYAEAKRAIQVLRNRSRTLEVTGLRVTGKAPTNTGQAQEPATGRAPKAPPAPTPTPAPGK